MKGAVWEESGLILILTGLSLSFVLVSFAIRVYIRHSRELWKLDDNILTAATFVACAQSAVVVRGVDAGLGDRARATLDVVLKFYLSNHYLYIVELFLSKAAVAALYLRLTAAHKHRIAIWSIAGTCAGWLILAILLISVPITWKLAYSIPFPRWLVIGVLDIATEVALCLMSGYLVKDLHLSLDRKLSVVSAFSVRLCTIIPCAIRLYYLESSTLASNRNLATSLAVVSGQLQLGISIMSASVAVLKPFMVVYDKSLVTAADYAFGASRPSHGGAYNYTPHSTTGILETKQNETRQSQSQSQSQTLSTATQNSTRSTSSHKTKRDSRRTMASAALQSLRSNLSIHSSRDREDEGNLTSSTIVSHSYDPNDSSPFAGCGRSTRIITSGRFPSLVEDLENARQQGSRTSDESGDSANKMIINRRDEWSVKYEYAHAGSGLAGCEAGHAHGLGPCMHRAVGMGPSVNGKGFGAVPAMDDLELGPMLGSDSEPAPILPVSNPAPGESVLRKNSISSRDYATMAPCVHKPPSISWQLPINEAETGSPK